MNLGALPELLLAWVKTQGSALLQGGKAETPSAFNIGQQYAGKVLDQLPGGRHLVQVASQNLDMALPKNIQSGDTVRLTFLSAGPRPTFVLNQAPVAPIQQVQLSSGAQQASMLMRMNSAAATDMAKPMPASSVGGIQQSSQPNTQASTQTSTQPLAGSSVARSLNVSAVSGSVTGAATSSVTSAATNPGVANPKAVQAMPSSARPIVANVVMLQNHTAVATGLTGAPLASAISGTNTGLMGQAVDGVRSAIPAHASLATAISADTADPSTRLLPTRLAQALRESGMFYEAHLGRWAKNNYAFDSLLNEPLARLGRGALTPQALAELGNMPEEAARMAGRQLAMLDGAPFLWQGFAWPGQWMEWLVEERQADQESSGEETPSDEWQTELRLTLPRMGNVHAQLALRAGTVNLHMTASDGRSVDKLRAALPSLQAGLEASGLQPASLLVEQGEV